MTELDLAPDIDESDVEAAGIDVLSVLDGSGREWWASSPDDSHDVAATIDIIGAQPEPTVVVGASQAVAQQIALSYFGPEDGADPSLWPEVLMEVANVVGGAIKAILGRDQATLSLPTPTTWPTEGGLRVHLESELGHLSIVLYPTGR